MLKAILSYWLIVFLHLLQISWQHAGCGMKYLKDAPILTVVEPTKQDKRLLINSTPHPLQIFGYFPSTTSTNIDISILRTIFGVASRYYSKVIQVTDLSLSSTLYPSAAGMCGISVPDKFVKEGFDQTLIDLVVFIVIQNNNAENYVAAASPCVKTRRPIYGFITFNAAFIKLTGNKPSAFHQNIYVTVHYNTSQIHEITHILGFNYQFYNHFYVSPTSSAKLGIDRVMSNYGLRKMIITSAVVDYIKNHFQCEDEQIGALLEDEGGQGTSWSHWERKVFMDELMTASDWIPGLRMSKLSLSLLQDTGFYIDVDLSLSETLTWGDGKGCKFAIGQDNSPPQYCLPDSKGCDYYSKYMGYCSNTDPFSNSTYIMLTYSSSVCTSPELQVNVGPPSDSNRYIAFGSSSRCFETQTKMSVCYNSTCIQNNSKVLVSIGNFNITCVKQDEPMTINNLTIVCPSNFTVFCSVRSCPNWCNLRGVCIQGKCLCNPPFYGDDCLLICPQTSYFDPQKQLCVDQCPAPLFVDPNRTCVMICPNTYIADQQRRCIICDSNCSQPIKISSSATYVFVGIAIILLLMLL